MLKLGGIINILIAIAHVVGLFWAEQLFEITGAKKGMDVLSQVYYLLPHLLTIFVAILFFIFGLYGISADGKIKELPYLKFGIFTIAFFYLFRGIGEQSYNITQGTITPSETIQSIMAIVIGCLFLFGGLKKWELNTQN